MSVSGFDQGKNYEGYAAILECKREQMASSHQVKRFFGKLSVITNHIFNKILNELFVWKLHITKLSIKEPGIDTMVFDNDSAAKRDGNQVTCKHKKGFQPLHISWGPFLVDVLFRKGSAHSNHGNDYINRVKSVVKLGRGRYSTRVPIILCADSDFADQKAHDVFEKDFHIHYITTGKLYKNVTEYVKNIPADTIVKKSHERESDELIHRSLKELTTKEQFPIKSFGMNRAYYFMLVFTHFIYKAYKQNVTASVISVIVYPNTFRRKLIDFTAKLTSRSGNIVLNVTKTVCQTIDIEELWKWCQLPLQIMTISLFMKTKMSHWRKI